MRGFFQSFYGKLSAIFLVLLLMMGIAQVYISIDSTNRFYSRASQKLNANLANAMTADFALALKDSIDKSMIEEMIHYMMVINPKIEIYLLDDQGKILAFFAEPHKKITVEKVDLAPIQDFINNRQQTKGPILGDNPRNTGQLKPFSAAPIRIGQDEGYLYVITESELFDSAADAIRGDYLVRTLLTGLLLSLIATGIIGLLLFAFLTRRLRQVREAVQQFEQGHYQERLPVSADDELGNLATSFNHMADTIVANMEELKKTDNLRRELVANVSHDLRSPLASIRGYLETILIKEDKLPAEKRTEYIKTILSTTGHLEKLVDQLFELSKLDAQQILPQFEAFPIADLVQDVTMKYKPIAEEKGINLLASVPQQLPMAYADIGLIERAISNLIENAIRYTESSGTVKIAVSYDRNKIMIQVSDTGCGISEADLPHIFDRFYRVEKSRARSTGGTGLGLAITKKILDIHQSAIDVQSKVNKGTDFIFDLEAAG